MPETLANKSVLVIGASSGMGRETALQFAREGANVTAVARRAERLREIASEVALTVQADAKDSASMENAVSAAATRFGGVDIMVYATGDNIPDRSMKRLNPTIWDHMIQVNLSGAYYASQAVLPGMRERKAGLLFYISSRSAVSVDESGAAYQAAKRGLIGLSQAIRLEEKDNGIRTCVVCPGLTDTEIILKRPVKTPEETVARALQPSDVAEMIVSIAKMSPRTWVPEVHLFPSQL